jgi:hypothetical protein
VQVPGGKVSPFIIFAIVVTFLVIETLRAAP